MRFTTTKENTVIDHLTVAANVGTNENEDQGTPVYLYHSLFTEMSQLGSDLMVEHYDDFDY